MKVLIYVICMLVYSMITTTINMNGITLGAIPTVVLFTLCMSPAWVYGKHYNQRKYMETYQNFRLEHMIRNVNQIREYVQNKCDFSNNSELLNVNEIFDNVIKKLSWQTEEENLKMLVKENCSPMAYAKQTVILYANEYYLERQKELKLEKDKFNEIETVFYDFLKLLNEMPIEKNMEEE